MTISLESSKFFVAVTGVAACIVSDLTAYQSDGTLGAPGRVIGLGPGDQVPWDGCECGQLMQVIQRGPYPSSRFPAEDNQRFGNCNYSVFAIQVLASLTRCQYHPVPDSSGVPPTADAQVAAGQLQQFEEYVMRNAITCCLQTMKDADSIDDFLVAASTRSVNGGCGETAISYYIQVIL